MQDEHNPDLEQRCEKSEGFNYSQNVETRLDQYAAALHLHSYKWDDKKYADAIALAKAKLAIILIERFIPPEVIKQYIKAQLETQSQPLEKKSKKGIEPAAYEAFLTMLKSSHFTYQEARVEAGRDDETTETVEKRERIFRNKVDNLEEAIREQSTKLIGTAIDRAMDLVKKYAAGDNEKAIDYAHAAIREMYRLAVDYRPKDNQTMLGFFLKNLHKMFRNTEIQKEMPENIPLLAGQENDCSLATGRARRKGHQLDNLRDFFKEHYALPQKRGYNE